MRKVQRTVPAPADMGTEVIGIPEGTDLELKLRLEAVMEGVLVSGTISGAAVGECIRCLEEVRLALDTQFTELFSYPENQVVEDADEEVRRVENELISRAYAARRGRACTTVSASVPGRLPGFVLRMWGAARGRPGAHARSRRPTMGGATGHPGRWGAFRFVRDGRAE